MVAYARSGLASIFILTAASGVGAQEPSFHVAVKGGAAIERAEDNLKGTVPAVAVTAAKVLSPAWRGEIEFWLPGYLELEDGGRHRDLLLSASAVRLFRSDGVRPFVLAGLSLTRTEDEQTHCFAERVSPTGGPAGLALVGCDEPDVVEIEHTDRAGTGIALVTGGGVEIPIGRRVNVVADVRLLLAPGGILVRPALGLGIAF